MVKWGLGDRKSPCARMLLFPEVQMTRFLATEGGSAEYEANALSERLPPAWAPPRFLSTFYFWIEPFDLINRPQLEVT